ncbi:MULTISPECIES: LysR family transcriptional regulator [unclassified Massilia]|uniref:LysR family transcriptional regulator n=1 Tax=unclassified Massilia TaxID=2609279 RepID=UPI001B8227B9|nr:MULTISPECIES: LysR family transcriptional regulator [unclassified Massilia]MBQ5940627.1 LysR family transcriptional regulator [Massilia sp. AB1]MBQ5961739.1 LysR family transcriptional regulator [Massilia sp. ZL223]
MDRLHLMSVFVAVAESESFSAAARRLGMSAPAVTRAVSALEQRLGVRLLTRTTRFVRATEAGLRYLEDARRILAEVDEADEAAGGVNATPRGRLAITAPVLFGRMYVAPVVVDYLRRYPDVTVSALFLDRVVHLVEEGLDAGIRIGHLPDSSLQAIRVGQVRSVLCASPAYLKERGLPHSPEDLREHVLIAASGLSPTSEWKFVRDGEAFSLKISPRLTVTTNDAAIEAALRGFGIARLLSYQVASQLAAGEMQIVLGDYEAPPLPIHVIHREGRHSAAKVRSFVDMVVERLRADGSLN